MKSILHSYSVTREIFLQRLFNVLLLLPKQRAQQLLNPPIWSVYCHNFFWTFEVLQDLLSLASKSIRLPLAERYKNT